MNRGEPSRLTCALHEWTGPDDVAWVGFTGRVEMDTAPAFRRQLEKLVQSQPRGLVVELTGVTYMDSAGVAVLVECLRWCRERGVDLVLLKPSKAVHESMEIVNLADAFEEVEDAPALQERFAQVNKRAQRRSHVQGA